MDWMVSRRLLQRHDLPIVMARRGYFSYSETGPVPIGRGAEECEADRQSLTASGRIRGHATTDVF
ncbi:MAG: hypothetical protein AAGE01_24440, partial [Pseudomonadota bacterium]